MTLEMKNSDNKAKIMKVPTVNSLNALFKECQIMKPKHRFETFYFELIIYIYLKSTNLWQFQNMEYFDR